MQTGRHDDIVEPGLQRFRNTSLKRMHNQRCSDTKQLGNPRRVTGYCRQHFVRFDDSSIGLDRNNLPPLNLDAGHLSLLVYLDAPLVRASSVSPRHGIVSRDGSGRMKEGAQDRGVPATTQVELWTLFANEFRSYQLAFYSQVFVDLGAPTHGPQRGIGVGKRKMTTLGVEKVDIQISRQILKQPYAFVV